jgi:anaerobic selenocysteine-containing dehydrogenase
MTASDGKPMVLFENVFPATPSGKVELKSEALATRWGDGALYPEWRERPSVSTYPLQLISPASDKRISSTLFGAGGVAGEAPPLFMNPRDAQARGLKGGKRVRVFNQRGAVILPLKITDAVAPGVVASEKGAWLATSPTGNTISALVSADARADLAQGACFNDTAVEVEAVS